MKGQKAKEPSVKLNSSFEIPSGLEEVLRELKESSTCAEARKASAEHKEIISRRFLKTAQGPR